MFGFGLVLYCYLTWFDACVWYYRVCMCLVMRVAVVGFGFGLGLVSVWVACVDSVVCILCLLFGLLSCCVTFCVGWLVCVVGW